MKCSHGHQLVGASPGLLQLMSSPIGQGICGPQDNHSGPCLLAEPTSTPRPGNLAQRPQEPSVQASLPIEEDQALLLLWSTPPRSNQSPGCLEARAEYQHSPSAKTMLDACLQLLPRDHRATSPQELCLSTGLPNSPPGTTGDRTGSPSLTTP